MEYFQNMEVSNANDNMIWINVKPRFSNKCKTANTTILTEKDLIMNN